MAMNMTNKMATLTEPVYLSGILSTSLSNKFKNLSVFSSDSACLLCSLADSACRKSSICWLAFLFLFLGDGVGVAVRVVDGVAGLVEETGVGVVAVVGVVDGVVGGLVEEAGTDSGRSSRGDSAYGVTMACWGQK